MSYEVLDHTADIKIRVKGGDLKELLENAARAMMEMTVSPETVNPVREIELSVSARTGEELLVRLLDEILYLGEVNKLVFCAISLTLDGRYRVSGVLAGESADARRHEYLNEIKGATYHNLKIEKSGDKLIAEIVFDI